MPARRQALPAGDHRPQVLQLRVLAPLAAPSLLRHGAEAAQRAPAQEVGVRFCTR